MKTLLFILTFIWISTAHSQPSDFEKIKAQFKQIRTFPTLYGETFLLASSMEAKEDPALSSKTDRETELAFTNTQKIRTISKQKIEHRNDRIHTVPKLLK